MYTYHVWPNRRRIDGKCEKTWIEVHGYTEESFKEEMAKNLEHFRKVIKTT